MRYYYLIESYVTINDSKLNIKLGLKKAKYLHIAM